MEVHPAHEVPCPICRAPVGVGCKYMIDAEHNGWVHVGRVSALQLRKGNAAAREAFTEEKYPLHPRVRQARETQ